MVLILVRDSDSLSSAFHLGANSSAQDVIKVLVLMLLLLLLVLVTLNLVLLLLLPLHPMIV